MKHFRLKLKEQSGAVAVTVAILLILLVGFAALAIDIGYLMVTRNELQNVADAAALAGARKLGENYQEMNFGQMIDYECVVKEWGWPCEEARTVAKEVGHLNRAGQVNITINDEDVLLGQWDFSVSPPFDATNDPFTPDNAQPKAVRVIARRDGTANNPITTFLAGVMGIDTMSLSAVATASLPGKGVAADGELELPVGIDGSFFLDPTKDFCHEEIFFSPTTLSCAGWTTWDYLSNTPNMRDLLRGIKTNPEVSVGGDAYNYTGGDLATVFDDLLTLFKKKGHDVYGPDDTPVATVYGTDDPITGALSVVDYPNAEPLYEEDGVTPLYYPLEPGQGPHDPLTPRNRHVWSTTVVVYEPNNCDNPNQELKTVGFARVRITDVLPVPNRTIRGVVDCGYVADEPTTGGGGLFGTFGPVPGLVQ